MNRRILNYQEEASYKIVEGLKHSKEFKLQAPTGSGKTMIMGITLEKIIQNPWFNLKKKSFVFVAPSTGSLDYQGYEKMTNYLNKGWVKGFDTSYIGVSGAKSKKSHYLENIDYFEENTVYFIGWSLFGKNSNLSKIDSEKNNIQRVIQNTKNKNVDIILIIDEAHREIITKSDNKQVILNEMSAWKTIELSATLDAWDHKVSLQQVRDESAIKKSVIISSGKPGDDILDKPGEIDDLIYSAIRKQNEVKKAYIKRKINDNPLILIQIPNKQKLTSNLIAQKSVDDYYLEEVEKSLDNHGLKKGINYALWINDEKTTKDKEELTKSMSPYDVIVFKQAIATGWDIPRANILVRLREPKSPKFDIQTLGRILRNPRFRYYDNYLIDNAFVFTRDQRYHEKISKEEFVSNSIFKEKVPLSPSGMKSNLSINTLYYSKPIIEEVIINHSFNDILKNYEIILNYFKKINDHGNILIKDQELDSIKILDNEVVENLNSETRRNKNIEQLAFKLHEDDTLFEIYIKYMASFEGKDINRKIMEKLIDLITKKSAYKKKEIYKKLISNEILDQRIKEFGFVNIFEYIERVKNKWIKELSEISYEEFSLPTEFRYKSEDIETIHWDKINTYNLSIKSGWDSDIEEDFYNEILKFLGLILKINNYEDDNPTIHLFRNGVSQNSYFIEYYDIFDKKTKFYPDFILIDDINKTADIIEIKGRKATGNDIDKNSGLKFASAWSNEEKIHKNYNVKFYRTERATSSNKEFNLIDRDGKSITLTDFISQKSRDISSKIK